MKIASRGIEKSQAILEVEVDQDRVDRALDAVYRRIATRVKVPGFRPGKAPRTLVERMVGRDAMMEDAIEQLLPAVYQEVVREQQLEPVASPKLELMSVSPLQFRATVPLKPKVELGDYRSIRVELEPTEPTPEEVEASVEELRRGYAEWVPVERAVQLGDRVSIDVRATAGDRVVLDSHDAEFVVEANEREPAPGFAEQLVGMQSGETREFELTWWSQARDRSLADQPVQFTVTVNWVKEKELPNADDDFAVRLGEFETMEQVREELAKQIRRQKTETAERLREARVLREVVAQSSFEVPPQMIEEEADERRERMARSLDRQGVTMEQYLMFRQQTEAEMRQELLAEAEEQVRRSFVLEAIAEAEQLTVSDTEIDEEIERAVADLPSEDPRRRDALARAETRRRVEALLRERKALQRLLELVTPAAGPMEGAIQA